MTTEQTRQDPAIIPSDNKTVFGPLGKYAIIAVLMVSIIVTTAIMLDKQLDTSTVNLAAVETETNTAQSTQAHADVQPQALQSKAIKSQAVATTTQSRTIIPTETTLTTAATQTPTQPPVKISTDQQTSTVTITAAQTSTPVPTATPVAPVKTASATTAPVVVATITTKTKNILAKRVSPIQPYRMSNTWGRRTAYNYSHGNASLAEQNMIAKINTQHKQIIAENMARIQAMKSRQKENMSGMFAHIQALETKQLQNFAANQKQQIAVLRNQLKQQQQMLNALKIRNADILKIRKTNILRAQQQRQAILKRI